MNTTTKHTPGPWKLEHDMITAKQFGLSKPIVARVFGRPNDEHVGNGMLIEAAPKLAEALNWFVCFCAEHPEWTAEQFPSDSSEGEWIEVAKEALTEAGLL